MLGAKVLMNDMRVAAMDMQSQEHIQNQILWPMKQSAHHTPSDTDCQSARQEKTEICYCR